MTASIDPRSLGAWASSPGGAAPGPDADAAAVLAGLVPSLVDDAETALLRSAALALNDGSDLSRLDGHAVADLLAGAAGGSLRSGPAASSPSLRALVPVAAPATPAPAAAPAPAPSPRAQAAPPPPAPADSTFGDELDVAAMVAVLVQAAQEGMPFCEECARAAAARSGNQMEAA